MKKLIFIFIIQLFLYGCQMDSEELPANFIDGKFVYDEGNIYTKNLDWTNQKKLTSDAEWYKPPTAYGYYEIYYASPLWSPDGSEILYIKNNISEGSTIGIMDNNGENDKVVLQNNSIIGTMDWSSDGQWIAYSLLYYPESGPIHIVRMDGQQQKIINENDSSSIEFISWSSDSKKIAYCNSGGELIIIDVETEEIMVHETDVWGIYSKPYWSPDDKYIVYSTLDPPTGKIVLLDVNDKSEKLLREGFGDSPVFGWTPDGEYIIYLGEPDKYRDFAALQVSSGQEKELVYKSDGWLDYPKGELFIYP